MASQEGFHIGALVGPFEGLFTSPSYLPGSLKGPESVNFPGLEMSGPEETVHRASFWPYKKVPTKFIYIAYFTFLGWFTPPKEEG